jgi:hypothetical protein
MITADVESIASSDLSASGRLDMIIRTLSAHAKDIAMNKGKIQDMVVTAHRERWRSFADHETALRSIVARVVEDGRRCDEFDRDISLEESCRAIPLILGPFSKSIAFRWKTLGVG